MKNSNTLEKKVDIIMATMVTKFDTLTSRIDGLPAKADFNSLSARVDGLPTKADFEMLSEDLDALAVSTKNGFDEVFERMVTKEEFGEKMEHIDYRLDRIENISIGGHDRRIEILEDRVRVVETKTKIKR